MSSQQVETRARSSSECTLQRELRVLEMLTTFYAAAGNPPESDEGLALMSKFLSERAEPQAINVALEKCLVECRYPIRLPDILRRLPGTEAADVNADKRRAWEVVEEFVSKHLRWNDDRTHAHIEAGAPPISKRVTDCVRRSGGWSLYLRMTDGDFPFVQKRFFEEWEAWTDVDRISRDPARALVFPELKQLAEVRAMDRLERGRDPAPAAPVPRTAATSPQKTRILSAIDNLRRRTASQRPHE